MAKTLRISLMLFGIAALSTMLYRHYSDPWTRKSRLESIQTMNALATAPNKLTNWPPVVGETFPDIDLYDHQGNAFSISSLQGKPTLVEILSMTCAGCQGFSGGSKYGGFGGFPSQSGLDSIEKYFKDYSRGHKLFSNDIHFVQIIVYNTELLPPSASDLAAWRAHFKLEHPNTFIVGGGELLANKASFRMIPGFLLLDRDLIVKFDATGHSPRHNLYTELLPAVSALIKQSKDK